MIHKPGQLLSLWRGPIDANMAAIAAGIAEREGVSLDLLRGRRNPQKLAAARREASIRMIEIGKSYVQIADFMHRDVATIVRDAKTHREMGA